jgi:hypothetical protein
MKLKTVMDFNLIVYAKGGVYEITPQGIEIPDEITQEILEKYPDSVEEVK